MKSDIVVDSIDHISEEAVECSATSIIPKNAVLMVVRSGILARIVPIAITGRELAINQDIKAFCPCTDLNPRFLFHFFNSRMDDLLADVSRGATVHRLMVDQIRRLCVPLPPLSEQRRIVSILDEAFENIAVVNANAEKNLQTTRELFMSHLDCVFSQRGKEGTERVFSDVCEISSTLVDPQNEGFLDLLHVGGANIVSKTGELIGLKTVREEELISGKFFFDKTMVLYSKIRPYLMKVARPDFQGLCSADIYPLSAKQELLDRNYLFYLLLSTIFTEYAIAGSARTGMPKVNRDHLFGFRFYLPKLVIQEKIAAQLDALSAETRCLESIYERKLAALDELKKSLLHQAFTGQL